MKEVRRTWPALEENARVFGELATRARALFGEGWFEQAARWVQMAAESLVDRRRSRSERSRVSSTTPGGGPPMWRVPRRSICRWRVDL